MNLLPQDVLVMLKLSLLQRDSWTYNEIAYELKMSPSMVHSAVKRTTNARLFVSHRKRPHRKALEEFLIHGVKYAFAAQIGTVTRGVPTAFAWAGLKDQIQYKTNEIYVWPHPNGSERGIELLPLYRSVPEIALADERLYSALAALDAIRVGRAREQKMAKAALLSILNENEIKTTPEH
ncbi:MAG: hypothetical protein GY847_17955 [Proteobacteria bacterium]|nr:hypothetical protein [Pseudomonadota bacterium]